MLQHNQPDLLTFELLENEDIYFLIFDFLDPALLIDLVELVIQ